MKLEDRLNEYYEWCMNDSVTKTLSPEQAREAIYKDLIELVDLVEKAEDIASKYHYTAELRKKLAEYCGQ